MQTNREHIMTEEQQAVLDAVMSDSSNGKIIAVQAVAGAGKTTTSVEVAKVFKPKRGFYTAFNKGIVQESAAKFKTLLESKTMHSFAYKYINPSRIGELTYDMIKENITYPEKKALIQHLDDFYRSECTSYDEYFDTRTIPVDMEDLIVTYVNKMYAGKIPSTFNYLLKCFHIMLVEGSVNPKYDLFILDECQDTTPVVLEIFKLLECDKKIMLGDKYQNIYSFLNTVNGFKLLDNTLDLSLTKSFRCCESVAQQVQTFGRERFTGDFKFTGNELLTDKPNEDKVFLSLTNSELIIRMYNLMQEGKGFSCVRTIDEIFSLPLAIVYAASGKKLFDTRYKFIEDERRNWLVNTNNRTFFQHLDNLGLDEVSGAIRTLKSFNEQKINIFNLKEAVKKSRPSKAITLSTAHSFKGLEKPIACIESSLSKKVKESDKDEELNNLYYVALSRAMYEIEYL